MSFFPRRERLLAFLFFSSPMGVEESRSPLGSWLADAGVEGAC
jgi:hypothetical protein